ncbi:MAG: ABC transporter ATP-binding protein [Deltaproteobacteria bacterium]|nr:ABC transporter ATP-binding protein [Deltaproteobacteria bacterium]MBW2306385.1 ABC transporter ATP-binding protein [Deltaproteobacteria bacterium]
MGILEAKDIRSGYGETEILHNVSIYVEKEEIVAIIGPNGAGKSTLMKTIFGLIRPSQGSVCLSGENITGLRPDKIVHKGMCYVPQSNNIFPSLNVRENLEMGAYIRVDDFSQRLQEIFSYFPILRERQRQRAGSLSGGEQQMLAMGRALMLNPRVLLLDEPSAGLAPRMVEEIFSKIAEIKKTGVAILMVEQNAKKALSHSDRGYVMAMGEKKYEGNGKKLLDDPEVGRLYLGG